MALELRVVGPLPKTKSDSWATDSLELMRDVLARASYTGTWEVKPVHQTRHQAGGRIRFTKAHGGVLTVYCRPGDNGTNWEWELRPPARAGHIDTLLKDLQLWNGFDGKIVPKAVRESYGDMAGEVLPVVNGENTDVITRIAKLQNSAARVSTMQQELVSLREDENRLTEELEKIGERIKELEQEIANDLEGKKACEALDALKTLLG